MSDEYGMRESDFTSHDRPKISDQIQRGYYKHSNANLVLVRAHLQDALQAGASGEVLRAIVRAIKEIER
jgi:hypothetical protein